MDENILERLLEEGTVSTVLCKNNEKRGEVAELQIILFQLGFENELQYQKFGADGYYGQSCIDAIKAFALCNNITTDGLAVSKEVAEQLVARYDILDELQDLHKDITSGTVSTIYKKGSNKKGAIASLQTLLHDLGYGEELQWIKYHNDGVYGQSTITAVAAFMKDENIEGDPNILNLKTAKRICSKLSIFYGKNWAKNLKVPHENRGVITIYSGSNFQGKKVKTVDSFIPHLERLNQIAKENNIKIHVTSSIRMTTNVKGAIVTPAKRSNHLAGHAIDMNLVYPGGWANSSYLKKNNAHKWDKSIANFIKAIREDKYLRWGGDFTPEDTVHIDDGLNIRDKAEWERCYKEIQNNEK